MTKRFIVNIIGTVFIALGIALMISTRLGAFPFDSVSKFVNIISGERIELGVANFVNNSILMLIAYFLAKERKVFFGIILTLLISLLLALFDFTLIPALIVIDDLWIRIIISLLGVFSIAIGSSLTIITRMFVTPVDQMMVILNKKFNSLFLSKIVLEGCFLAIAVVLGLISGNLFEQINLFTIVAILILSPLIDIVYKYLSKLLNPILFEKELEEYET